MVYTSSMDTKEKYTMTRITKDTRQRMGEVRKRLEVSSYDALINAALDALEFQLVSMRMLKTIPQGRGSDRER